MGYPNWPAPIEGGLIPTDNAMGIMTQDLSPAAEAFVSLAGSAKRPLLEIGAAYGNATLPALAAGATVIANDISASELSVLAESAPVHDRRRLVLMPAAFPDELPLADASVSAILAAQVLHFFDGPTVERAFSAAFRWLEPGGSFHVLVMTPSLSFYSKLREKYERRVASGERWPGIFDPRDAAPPEWVARLPERVHLFEKAVCERCCREAGFEIKQLEYFCFTTFPPEHRTDGHEYVTLIARKPV